jgi:3-isopropylmalate/(R)-2-methylmalate dehydratase small subunit
MQPFTILTGIAAPLARSNVDTEVIIPIARLIAFPRGQLGPYAFEPWRYDARHQPNADFVLNQPKYAAATVLVAGENFGCGSSREHAVWALWDMGLRCIIAPSFGDIFRANSYQNGLLTITLEQDLVNSIVAEIEADPAPRMTIDLARGLIDTPAMRAVPFAIDAERRVALLEGLDEIGLTQKYAADISAFAHQDRAARPWAYQKMDDSNV